MSRIGRKPIPLPSGVKVAMQGGKIDVQGPKGKLSFAIPRGITFEQKDGVLTALRETEDHRALHGLARALVALKRTWISWALAIARNSRARL
jgi:large subunit ribosomal protein L6